ncbi:hypothetical protein LguiB_029051 [Lonicera macranthoides]
MVGKLKKHCHIEEIVSFGLAAKEPEKKKKEPKKEAEKKKEQPKKVLEFHNYLSFCLTKFVVILVCFLLSYSVGSLLLGCLLFFVIFSASLV